MPTQVVVLQIDDSSDKTIVGQQTWDRANGGILVAPAGNAFPGSPAAGEIFWRSDQNILYRRNDTNTAWDALGAAPTGQAGGDLDGYYPNPEVIDLTIFGEQQGSILYFNGSNWVVLDPGPDGYVLTTHGTLMDPSWEEIADGGMILFGASSVAATTTTRYLIPGVASTLAPTVAVSMAAPRDGTLKNLFIRHNISAGNGNNIVYTVRINSVASSLSVTLASTGNQSSDIVNQINVNQGDLIDIEVTKALAIGATPNGIIASLEFV
ncbi:MAG: hypothetical protein HC877_24060 [Thioploca sp.]|nr:hypothetical protein [Thioploca sp.]